jgi:Peptidase inhibitor family I36
MRDWAVARLRPGWKALTRMGVIVALLGGTLLVLPGVPAHAVPQDCDSGELCIWRNANFVNGSGSSAGPGVFRGNNSDWNNFSHPSCPYNGTWNNCASSAINDKSGQGAILWETVGFHDGTFCIPALVQIPNFATRVFNNGHTLNDRVSANKFGNAC